MSALHSDLCKVTVSQPLHASGLLFSELLGELRNVLMIEVGIEEAFGVRRKVMVQLVDGLARDDPTAWQMLLPCQQEDKLG